MSRSYKDPQRFGFDLRLPLESTGQYYALGIRPTEMGGRLSLLNLQRDLQGKQSSLDDSFLTWLKLENSDGHSKGFYTSLQQQEFGYVYADKGPHRLLLKGRELAAFDTLGNTPPKSQPLSTYETRYWGERNRLPELDPTAQEYQPQTDLHTHFTGILSGDALLEVGKKNRIPYPSELLVRAGIPVPSDAPNIPLDEVNWTPANAQRFNQLVSIPIDRGEDFDGLEQIYRARDPICKNPKAFTDLCLSVGKTYQRMGISYAEPSFSAISNPDFSQQLGEAVDQTEAQTGVRLRFLGALYRHSPLSKQLETVQAVTTLMHQPEGAYIKGLDINGEETNRTQDMARAISAFCQSTRDLSDPVLRIHAGETDLHPGNVRECLEVAEAHPWMQLRIGHGVYGSEAPELVERMHRRGVTVEVNVDSNLALHGIEEASQVPLKRYLDGGVPVVMGTDGPGIYQISQHNFSAISHMLGLSRTDLQKMEQAEQTYLQPLNRGMDR